MIIHYVIRCPGCGRHSCQSQDDKKTIAQMVFKCKYCDKTAKSRHKNQKFAGLQFKYWGPFNGEGAAQLCKQLNGADKEVGFATYKQ